MKKTKKKAAKKRRVKKTLGKETLPKIAKKEAKKKKTSVKARSPGPKPVPKEKLRWRCEADKLPFASTVEVKPLSEVVVQQWVINALRYGLRTQAPGHNIYVRGMTGTGRTAMVRLLCEELRQSSSTPQDRCYVRNFNHPDRPRLITLPPGKARDFKRSMEGLIEFIGTELDPALSSSEMKARTDALALKAKTRIEEIVRPFEEVLKSAGLTLVTYQTGPAAQAAIFPIVDGKPVSPEEFDQLHFQGQISAERYAAYKENTVRFEQELEEVNRKAHEIGQEHRETVRGLAESYARWILRGPVREIEERFPQECVRAFLDELVDDLVNLRLKKGREEGDFTRLYRVNVLMEHKEGEGSPIVIENSATVRSLVGAIDLDFGPGGEARVNHMGIRAGSLLRADDGFLIMDIRDLHGEPAVWKTLVRTLRTGLLEIEPASSAADAGPIALKPEAIPLRVKVVLMGDADTYYLLDANDKDFSQLFKVVVDFSSVIPRDEKGIQIYAQALARFSRMEELPPFESSAVVAMAEHGARIAGRGGMLTTCLDRITDIAHEAAYLTMEEKRAQVTGDDIRRAVHCSWERADLPSRRFRELVDDGTMLVETKGARIGQINGLAVMKSGTMTYGFPARITATIGPGTAGVINIEREAALSGAIHTKGFYILGGLLRRLLRTHHPLAFDASVAFEQSYGGIDGDSASGAEICCLLSALTDIPIHQDMAMTGAIDQVGHLLSVGAVNEKIEGFFDVCRDGGFTGGQGVIIPASNVKDLMLRGDVIEACGTGEFSVFAVETVMEAIEILTGLPAGVQNEKGLYPKGTLLHAAKERAYDFWVKASQKAPRKSTS